MEYVALIIGGIVLSIIFITRSESGKKASMEKQFEHLSEFNTDQLLLGLASHAGLGIDQSAKKICIIHHEGNESFKTHIVNYRDILSVELVEDGASVTKTNRISQASGAMIGGLALGGLGVILGGLSGKTKTENKVSKIQLNIVINNPESPLHTINLLGFETKKTSILYKEAIKEARYWISLIEVLIKQADRDDKLLETSGNDNGSFPPNKIDELQKLSQLLKDKLISEEEFNNLKKDILENSDKKFETKNLPENSGINPPSPIPVNPILSKPVDSTPEHTEGSANTQQPLNLRTAAIIIILLGGLAFLVFSSQRPRMEAETFTIETTEQKVEKLLAQAKALPVKPYEPNLEIYKKLSKLDPLNMLYRDKIIFYSNKIKKAKYPDGQKFSYTPQQLQSMIAAGRYPPQGSPSTKTQDTEFYSCRKNVISTIEAVQPEYPVETITETLELYTAKVWTNDSAMTLSCSKLDRKLIITTAPYN